MLKSLVSLALLASAKAGPPQPPASLDAVHALAACLQWTGQASFIVRTKAACICIDPLRIEASVPADLVLITHAHADHLSPTDLARVVTEKTVVVAPADCVARIRDLEAAEIVTLRPGDRRTLAGVSVEAVPAYNTTKRFHPRANNWVGYILTLDGVRLYHAGDTNRIPEMKTFACDIALLPLGQTYTMDRVDEAAQAVRDVRARLAIPMHYGLYEGKDTDATRFQEALAGDCEVRLLRRPSP